MPKRALFERSRRELFLDVSVGVHILLVVEQSSLESQSRGCAKTPILTGKCRCVGVFCDCCGGIGDNAHIKGRGPRLANWNRSISSWVNLDYLLTAV